MSIHKPGGVSTLFWAVKHLHYTNTLSVMMKYDKYVHLNAKNMVTIWCILLMLKYIDTLFVAGFPVILTWTLWGTAVTTGDSFSGYRVTGYQYRCTKGLICGGHFFFWPCLKNRQLDSWIIGIIAQSHISVSVHVGLGWVSPNGRVDSTPACRWLQRGWPFPYHSVPLSRSSRRCS